MRAVFAVLSCVIVVKQLQALPAEMTEDWSCHYPFIRLASGCYHFTSEQVHMNWIQGAEYCRALGGDLLTVDNEEENNVIRQYLIASKINKDSFIGGYDWGHESAWCWQSTLDRIQYSNWAPGEPNNKRGIEHCMEIREKQDWKWNDTPCTEKYSIVCEAQICPYLNK